MAQRLRNESSPYLRQHADNPVDWYPWGDDAFARARKEDKPVFVSIGYAACHWCHVMAHESFEDEATAALMNQHFVNVKVDREERPDVDAVYMAAIHAAGEGGGWPLSAFCDSNGRPFFLGTYFPPDQRYGRPGFKDVILTMARVFHEKREQVEDNATVLLNGLREIDLRHRAEAAARDGAPLDAAVLITSGRRLAQISDTRHGGFGTRPKFPSCSAHALLARAGRLKFGQPGREAFLKQCDGMANGGIYDHLGGGFARYSVDDQWLVPHFEKMLYDNAQLLEIYGDAFAMTQKELYRQRIVETVGWLEREMLDRSGGLYSSLDADSEGEEGKFYVFTPEQVEEVLGAGAAELCRVYGITTRGNFEHGTSVLSRVVPIGDEASEARLSALRQTLLAARDKRVRPATDDKILAGWNGLAISGLLRAYGATGHAPARALAEQVARFLWDRMISEEGGRIARVFHDGDARLFGTIDDFAFVGRAFLDLAEVTESDDWWQRGRRLLQSIVPLFHREEEQGPVLYMVADDDAKLLVHRPESHHDGAIPSGAAVAIDSWLRLGRVSDDRGLFERAEAYLQARVPAGEKNPFASAHLLLAFDRYLHGAELVVSDGAGRDQLISAARREYAPTLSILGPWARGPLLTGKTAAADGRAQAYLCKGQTCQAPTSDPAALASALAPSA